MSGTVRTWFLRAGLGFVAGVALDAAFPGRGWWWLAGPALTALFLLVQDARVAAAAATGAAFGLGFFVPHLSWSGIYVGPGPWLALAGLQALYIAGFAAAVALVRRAGASARLTLLSAAPLWVGQEALRARTPFGGFPWGRVAFSQVDSPALGWAWVGGAPVVSLTVALAASGLAVTTMTVLRTTPDSTSASTPASSRRTGRAFAAVGACLPAVAGVLIPVSGALLPIGAGTTSSGTTQVAAVQGNVAKPGLDFNAERRQVLNNHVQATTDLATNVQLGRTPRPDLVLWPENSSDIDPTRDAQASSDIARAAAAIRAPLVVGAVMAEPAPKVSNTTLAYSTNGTVTGRYVKRRPVPFAEYIPYRSFFRTLTTKVDLVRTDFAAGRNAPTLDVGALRLGVAICFEVAFDDQLRSSVRNGAQLLFVPTNNATFGRTDESVQQLAMSRLRAVELGRSVAHVSTVGVSALIRPDGTIAQSGGHFTREVLTDRLELRTDLTPAARAGAWPELLVSAAGVIVPIVGSARRVRRQSNSSPTKPLRRLPW